MSPNSFVFQKAVKGHEKLRMALDGVTGGGKTWTALTIGCYIAEREGGRVALIDSERSSAKKYAPFFDFDHLTLPNFDPQTYTGAIEAAIDAGYSVIIIDSLSHAWEGTLDLKDRVTKRSQSHNSYDAWREVTPIHNQLIDTMLRAPAHVIATLRTKMDNLIETDEKGHMTKVTKVGLKPQQREGVEYEFDIVADMNIENDFIVSKTRCFDLQGVVVNKPGKNLAETIYAWIEEGEPVIGAAEANALVELLNSIGDIDLRKTMKFDFVGRFGRPEALLVSRFEEAIAWCEAQIVTDEPAEATPVVEESETAATGVPAEEAASNGKAHASAADPSNNTTEGALV